MTLRCTQVVYSNDVAGKATVVVEEARKGDDDLNIDDI